MSNLTLTFTRLCSAKGRLLTCTLRLATGLAITAAITSAITPPAAANPPASSTSSPARTTPSATPQPRTQPNAAPRPSAPPATVAGLNFQQAMRVGYAASRRGDFNTALINFRRALIMRPGQPYAAAAADNMSYYLQHARVSERQQVIDQLQTRLERATAQQDWVCAATTLDELVAYSEPDSLNRERLIGQRGEISGLLDARMDHERWSTICAAQRPVY
jgi:hypothetical protein